MALIEEEAEIAKRIRLVRKEQRFSEQLAATRTGLSRDQLRRIEREEVAVRFFPAWNFCQVSNTNPLWLAFGEPEKRSGFIACANSTVGQGAKFLEVMRRYGEQYRTFRFLTHESWRGAGSVFSDNNPLLSAEFVALRRRADEGLEKNLGTFETERKLFSRLLKSWGVELGEMDAMDLQQYVKRIAIILPNVKDFLTFDTLDLNLAPMIKSGSRWKKLRERLQAATETRGAKAKLARDLGVDRQFVTQWLKHAERGPAAETALRLLEWVVAEEAKQKESAAPASTGAARKTRKSRSTTNEKAKSIRPKQYRAGQGLQTKNGD